MLMVPDGTKAALRRDRTRDRMWVLMYCIEAWVDQGRKCAYCHEPTKRSEITADHVEAMVRGGSTSRRNIKAACQPCNIAKGSMSEQAFLKLIKSPPSGCDFRIWLAWSRRRIWLRTERACKRIERCVT